MIRTRYWLLLVLWLPLLAACQLLDSSTGETAVTPTVPVIPSPANTPQPISTPLIPTVAAQPAELTLTVWTMADVSPRSEVPGGPTLIEQLAAFDLSHPNLTLNVELKTVADQGGSLNYLRTGRDVAPDVLPDLILLPSDQVPAAAAEGLIYPLDNLLDQALVDDLFPAARALFTHDGNLYAMPYMLSNLQHAVYNTTAITDTLATTWEELLASEQTFVFPADGLKGSELALQLYLDSGGRLLNDANRPHLDVDSLTLVLSGFAQGRNQGIVVPQSGNIISLEGSWQSFQNGEANVAQTTAAQYLSKRQLGVESGFAPLPGLNGPLTPRVQGRGWAITTGDPVFQALAVELIAWLSSADNLGDWSLRGLTLPARRSAFDRWPADDPYVSFLTTELERAQPWPRTATNDILTVLGTAVADVVSLATSAPAASAEAAGSITP